MKKRPLGQNFLIDEDIAGRIIDLAGVSSEDHVVEIGPGPGILTGRLLEQAGRLTAIEVDPKLSAVLREQFGAHEKFRLIEADAVKFDFSELGDRFKVVSNLPYYAATHILKRLIQFRAHITDMTVMLQKEVVDRLVAQAGQKEYGSLTVFIGYHCRVERLLEVDRTAFSPAPKIDSSVVKLIPHAKPPVQVDHPNTFFKIVHGAFLHKRKMLKNNLRPWSGQYQKDNGTIHIAGIDLTRRGETLTLEDFAALSNHIHASHD